MTDKTAGNTAELRQFLNQYANATTPWTYTDRNGIDHQCYLIRANEMTVKTSKLHDEPVLAITLIETTSETHEGGATGARAQELFLLDCADQVTPLDLTDRAENVHRVYISHLQQKQRRTRKAGIEKIELLYEVKFVDAWGGVYLFKTIVMTLAARARYTFNTHTTGTYGNGDRYGFSQDG